MKVTVFTSCYNQGKFLAEAINSVLTQTHEDIEYLLYDDGSEDDTWRVIKSFDDPRIKSFKLVKQPNVGCVINRSWRNMTGEAWVWCPADDFLHPNCIEEKVKLSQHNPSSVIYSDWKIVTEDGKFVRNVLLQPKTSDQFSKDIWHKCDLGFTGIYIPLQVIKTTPLFPTDMDCGEDYFWTLKAIQTGVPFIHLPLITHGKRHHDNRTTVRHKPDRAAIATRAAETG